MIAYYIKLDTQEYPFYLGDVHNLHPEFNGGQPDPTLYGEVQFSNAPEVQNNETFDELKPECIDGVWRQVFLVRAKTEIEIANEQISLQKAEERMTSYEQQIQQMQSQSENTTDAQSTNSPAIDAPLFVMESVKL